MGVLSRSGAQVGDVISVTGPLGGSLLGRHLHPEARNAEALVLAAEGIPHAMMDLSDGLSRDLPRLCLSSGVGALVHAERVPIHADALRGEAGAVRERTPLECALHDGEDFELLLAHAPLTEEQRVRLASGGVHLHAIGDVRPPAAGLHLKLAGVERPWQVDGFDHITSG
jgi:thiamine-monophosphate kinase